MSHQRVFVLSDFDMNVKMEVTLKPSWKRIADDLAKVTQIAARNIETGAKRDVPVDTGATRNSISANELGRFEWSVGPTTFYAPFLEFGTVYMIARPFMNTNAEKERPRFVEAVRQITEDL